MPDLDLPTTGGRSVNFARGSGMAIVYCYPWTGRPGLPNPPDWDDIPGAHGSTPEAEGFRDLHAGFHGAGASVYGLSTQTTEYHRELAERLGLPFELVSDERFTLQRALALPTFATGGVTYLTRLTLAVRDGRIERVYYPISLPAAHAREVCAWLGMRHRSVIGRRRASRTTAAVRAIGRITWGSREGRGPRSEWLSAWSSCASGTRLSCRVPGSFESARCRRAPRATGSRGLRLHRCQSCSRRRRPVPMQDRQTGPAFSLQHGFAEQMSLSPPHTSTSGFRSRSQMASHAAASRYPIPSRQRRHTSRLLADRSHHIFGDGGQARSGPPQRTASGTSRGHPGSPGPPQRTALLLVLGLVLG